MADEEGYVGDQATLVQRQTGRGTVKQWSLNRTILRIGRGADNDVILAEREVSRHHAEIRKEGESFVVTDLGSTNGTFVNGQRITRPMRLRDGDLITIAGQYEMVFVDADATTPVGGQVRATLRIDPVSRAVIIRGRELDPPLSPGQFAFMELLISQPGRVFTRQEVIEAVWPDVSAEGVTDQAIDALVRRLRERLEELDAHQYVVTVRGHGFRMEQP
ncbi:MAG: FHA domain-containing protein [Anaerolineae bacterium]